MEFLTSARIRWANSSARTPTISPARWDRLSAEAGIVSGLECLARPPAQRHARPRGPRVRGRPRPAPLRQPAPADRAPRRPRRLPASRHLGRRSSTRRSRLLDALDRRGRPHARAPRARARAARRSTPRRRAATSSWPACASCWPPRSTARARSATAASSSARSPPPAACVPARRSSPASSSARFPRRCGPTRCSSTTSARRSRTDLRTTRDAQEARAPPVPRRRPRRRGAPRPVLPALRHRLRPRARPVLLPPAGARSRARPPRRRRRPRAPRRRPAPPPSAARTPRTRRSHRPHRARPGPRRERRAGAARHLARRRRLPRALARRRSAPPGSRASPPGTASSTGRRRRGARRGCASPASARPRAASRPSPPARIATSSSAASGCARGKSPSAPTRSRPRTSASSTTRWPTGSSLAAGAGRAAPRARRHPPARRAIGALVDEELARFEADGGIVNAALLDPDRVRLRSDLDEMLRDEIDRPRGRLRPGRVRAGVRRPRGPARRRRIDHLRRQDRPHRRRAGAGACASSTTRRAATTGSGTSSSEGRPRAAARPLQPGGAALYPDHEVAEAVYYYSTAKGEYKRKGLPGDAGGGRDAPPCSPPSTTSAARGRLPPGRRHLHVLRVPVRLRPLPRAPRRPQVGRPKARSLQTPTGDPVRRRYGSTSHFSGNVSQALPRAFCLRPPGRAGSAALAHGPGRRPCLLRHQTEELGVGESRRLKTPLVETVGVGARLDQRHETVGQLGMMLARQLDTEGARRLDRALLPALLPALPCGPGSSLPPTDWTP